MTRRTPLFATVIITILTGLAAAQNSPKPAAEESGITAYVRFAGTANSDGEIYELNSNIGYDFNSHLGMAVGAILVHPAFCVDWEQLCQRIWRSIPCSSSAISEPAAQFRDGSNWHSAYWK
jgi:hypothetical protein